MSLNYRYPSLILGVDLDHTLISYERPLTRWARLLGVNISAGGSLKNLVRDHCWNSPEGDRAWQRVQADIYGHSLHEADPAEGALEFLAWARASGITVVIVSHKTPFAAAAPSGPNLHDSALRWLRDYGILSEDTGLTAAQVFLEPTRLAKVERIAALRCTHFVDDLPEVFLARGFPKETAPILFSPLGNEEVPWKIARSWDEIRTGLDSLWLGNTLSRISHDLEKQVECLGQVHAGRKSRVHCITLDGRVAALKFYNGHLDKQREFDAFELLHRHGVDDIPRPHDCISHLPAATYEWIEGERIMPGATAPEYIDAAIDFLARINRSRELKSEWVHPAREATFTIDELVKQNNNRILALLVADARTAIAREMIAFIKQELDPLLNRSIANAHQVAIGANASVVEELAEECRVLSPSDFGIHNAIRRRDGKLIFVDFEYFGWDDPCKLVSDFLLHPAMDLSIEQGQRFLSGIADKFALHSLLEWRLPAAYPLFGVKWCTILLNEFLRQNWERRVFAGDKRPRELVMQEQLAKARVMAAKVKEALDDFPYAI